MECRSGMNAIKYQFFDIEEYENTIENTIKI